MHGVYITVDDNIDLRWNDYVDYSMIDPKCITEDACPNFFQREDQVHALKYAKNCECRLWNICMLSAHACMNKCTSVCMCTCMLVVCVCVCVCVCCVRVCVCVCVCAS